MRQTYNVDALDKRDKVQPGPQWVTKEVVDMWYRIDARAKETGISYTKTANKYGFSPSSVYNTIAYIKRGMPPRDTDLRIIEALSREMRVPLNYLVHGTEQSNQEDKTNICESVIDNIFALSGGDYLSLFLMTLPYLNKPELESIKGDITARIG